MGSPLTEDERKEMVTLYTRGLSMEEVAAALGRSYGLVYQVLDEEEGLPRRRRRHWRCRLEK